MIFKLDNIDQYNQTVGIETVHPLITVCNLRDVPNRDLIDNEELIARQQEEYESEE